MLFMQKYSWGENMEMRYIFLLMVCFETHVSTLLFSGLQKTKMATSQDSYTLNVQEEPCIICLNNFIDNDKPKKLIQRLINCSCGDSSDCMPRNTYHLFDCSHNQQMCFVCIVKMLRKNRMTRCPYCRAPQIPEVSGVIIEKIYGPTYALFLAIKDGDIQKIEQFLDTNTTINVTFIAGQTPLHVAARFNKTHIVRLLLQRGADQSIRNDNGRTALHIAALCGNIETITILVAAGTDINATDNFENTPLFYAATRNHTTIIDFLLQHGAT